jgi:hypothetical protein
MAGLELQELLGFDDADLGANRLGRLTERQKQLLAAEHKSQRSVFLGVGAAIVFLFCGLPAFMLFTRGPLPGIISTAVSSQAQEVSFPSNVINSAPFKGIGSFALAAVPFIIVIAAVAFLYYKRASRKADTEVKRAEGPVNFVYVEKRVRNPGNSAVPYKDIQVLQMRVGADTTFGPVSEKLPNLINQGDEFIFHYTTYPFRIISAEPVKKR